MVVWDRSVFSALNQPPLRVAIDCNMKLKNKTNSFIVMFNLKQYFFSFSGVLYNTEPLDYSRRHNYILDVVVQDCGGRFSNKIIVNVKVVEACKPGWTGKWSCRYFVDTYHQSDVAFCSMINFPIAFCQKYREEKRKWKKFFRKNINLNCDSMFVTMISEMERKGSLLFYCVCAQWWFMNTSVMWGQQLCL